MELASIGGGVFAFLVFLIYVSFVGLSVYGLILFIKLARRGIKALDIYLNEKGC
ncbi:hypothetical protein QNH46_02745 [Paenibacillus woosongensis]|uniref:Uncharacterized protein n=1 Tax=Paenibacillus woosongensis TaxID=307580 RepID=A0AA95IAR1_9BACL|nr:hypothetical protein [Paenibacillus woosongensis]WHX49622.1 hypothetical protein QNH46_02745 [Paenibacillus woosongensis]